MVWWQDAVSLCDTGRTWHCLSELMVADYSQEYTKQRVLEITFTAWTVIALSFLGGPHYVLYTVQMRILMWTQQNIKQCHCGSFFFLNNIYLVTTLLMTILTFTWRENKNNVQERKEKYNVTAFTTNFKSHCDYWQDLNHLSENWNTNMIYVF